MVKVIQFIHGLNVGGAETLVKDYALNLNRNLIDLTVLCYEHYDSPYEKILKDAGIKVIYICDEMFLYGRKEIWARAINKILFYLKVKNYIHKLNPDVIHTHLILNAYLKFARPKKKTVIFYTQHFQVKRWIRYFGKDIKALRWLMKHYKVYVIALNNSMKQEIDKVLDTDKTIVMNSGIDVARFSRKVPEDIVKRKIEIPKDAFIVGHVGRFSTVKNHEFLIDIFGEIVKKRENAFLLMVGNGETMETIRKKVRILGLDKRVIILSDRTDVPELMGIMDILIFPSFSEGMPVTLVEAQIVGIRCLVADSVSKEIVFSNLVKYKSLKESKECWADEALSWKNDNVKYYGVDKWDITKIVKKLEGMYLEVVEESNRESIM